MRFKIALEESNSHCIYEEIEKRRADLDSTCLKMSQNTVINHFPAMILLDSKDINDSNLLFSLFFSSIMATYLKIPLNHFRQYSITDLFGEATYKEVSYVN